MARSNASVAAAAAVASASHHVVFVDTSLDTRLAIAVTDSDTVSDLKKKIIQAHAVCFSKIGEIKISAVKVKRRGHSYHLHDPMPVISAFNGVKKGWFLSVDASSPLECLPLVANTDAWNAIVEFGGSHDVHETGTASKEGIKALQDLASEGEAGGTLNRGEETILHADKYPKLRNEDRPLENIPSKKRRKIERQESDTPNSDDATLPLERTKEINDDGNVSEPEKTIVIGGSLQGKSSEAIDSIDVQQTVNEKMQSPLEENGSLPLVTKTEFIEQIVQNVETNSCSLRKRKKSHKPRPNYEAHEASVGNVSTVEHQQPDNFDQSGCTLSHKMNSYESEGKANEIVDAIKESCKKNGAEKELCQEIKETTKDVKEKTNNTTEKWNSNEKYVHQTSDRSEEEQSNRSEMVRDEIAVMDGNNKSSKEHRDGSRTPGDITGDAEVTVKERKKRSKKRSDTEKSVDQTRDIHGRLQSSSPKGKEKGVGSVALEQNPDKDPMDKMTPLEYLTKKAAFEDNISEMTKIKKTRRGGSKEKKDCQSSDAVGQEDVIMSQAKGTDTPTFEDNISEMAQIKKTRKGSSMEKKAFEDNIGDMTQIKKTRKGSSKEKKAFEDNIGDMTQIKKTRKGSSKEKKDDQSSDTVSQEDSIMLHAKGTDTPAVYADGKELGNMRIQMLPIAEKLEHSDNFEDKTMKTAKEGANGIDPNKEIDADRIDKQETNFTQAGVFETLATVADKSNTNEQHGNEKDANLSSYQNDKVAFSSLEEGREAVVTVAAESKPYELNGNEMCQLQDLTGQSSNANIGKEKRKKKSARRTMEKNAGLSKDRVDTNQSYASQEKSALTAISESFEGEQGNGGLSSQKIMGNPTKPDNDVLETLEKNMKQGPKIKGIDQSSNMNGKEKESHCQSADGDKSVTVITENKRKKAGKRTKSEQSYSKSIQPCRDMENNTVEECTSGLDILAKITKANDQDLNAPSPHKIASSPATGGSYSLVQVQSSEAIKQSTTLHEVSDNVLPVNHSDEVNNSVDKLHPRDNINFRDYFVPQQSHREVSTPGNSLVDEGPKETGSGSKLKVKCGKKKITSSTVTSSGQLNVQTGSRRGVGRSKGKSSFENVKSLSIDKILRSSSAYKKARLTAASKPSDDETQLDEFVPDSQANL
ncbi:hypothetical protein SAY86_003183 [Trapa natans]|uniref:Uncharacterized protein n=1 Tax=Trapa natans TaxID=22666 RepID=A0AAN7LLE3_TRANT|nr:hypothetical protein SAY86_003183 [Trapa natans]